MNRHTEADGAHRATAAPTAAVRIPALPGGVGIELCTPEQVAKLTGLSLETLAQWRSRRKAIPYLKIGRRVRYDSRDVLQYLEQCRVSVRKGQKP